MKRVSLIMVAVATALALAGCAGSAQVKSGDASLVKVPAGEVIMLDDFEDGLFWELDSTVPDGLDIDLSGEKGVMSGDNAMLFMFKETGWALVTTRQPLVTDWTGANYFVFDVYNDGTQPVEMGFTLMDGDNWEWQQSPSIVIEPGQQTFVAGLTDGTFLSTAGGLHAIDAPNGVENIAFIAICVHKAVETTTVYIDNVRLIK